MNRQLNQMCKCKTYMYIRKYVMVGINWKPANALMAFQFAWHANENIAEIIITHIIDYNADRGKSDIFIYFFWKFPNASKLCLSGVWYHCLNWLGKNRWINGEKSSARKARIYFVVCVFRWWTRSKPILAIRIWISSLVWQHIK